MDFNTNKFFVNRDVIFQEHVFSFASMKAQDHSTDFLKPYTEVNDDTVVESDINHHDTNSISPEEPTQDISVHPPLVDTPSEEFPTHTNDMQSLPTINPPRKTPKVSKQPIWRKNYAAPEKSKGKRCPLANYLSYCSTTPSYQC